MSRPYTPRPRQIEAINHVVSHRQSAIFYPPGRGKTSVMYAAISVLLEENEVHSPLVVCMRAGLKSWRDEVAKWDDFHGMKTHVMHPDFKTMYVDLKADVHVINFDGLPRLMQMDGADRFDMMTVDESTKIKHARTDRAKNVRAIANGLNIDWRQILTGTPAPRGMMDLFGQFLFLDGGARLGQYITKFRYRFFIEQRHPGQTWSTWELRPGAKQEIEDAISDITISISPEEHRVGMPELITNEILIELPKDVMKQYRELERHYVTILQSGKRVSAANAGVVSMKLRQLVSGVVYTADGSSEIVHDGKLEALHNLVDEMSGQPLLVGVAFLPEVDAIRAYLSKKYPHEEIPYIGSGMSMRKVNETVDAWNRKEFRVMLGHPASMALSLNLQFGSDATAWFSQPWDAELYEQFIGRVWRPDQPSETVTAHNLLAEGTVDVDILKSQIAKEDLQGGLLRRLA